MMSIYWAEYCLVVSLFSIYFTSCISPQFSYLDKWSLLRFRWTWAWKPKSQCWSALSQDQITVYSLKALIGNLSTGVYTLFPKRKWKPNFSARWGTAPTIWTDFLKVGLEEMDGIHHVHPTLHLGLLFTWVVKRKCY